MNRGLLIVWLLISLSGSAQVPLSTKSKRAIELYTEADNYRVRGQNQQALTLLEEALRKDKNFVEAYYRTGLVYMSMKNFTQALTYFEKGVSLTTDVKKKRVFWYDMGEAYLNTGQYEKAQAVLGNYIRAENQNLQKADRARQMMRNAEFARNFQTQTAEYKQRQLSDTVNCYYMQYFPVLTADQQFLIFTRRLGNGPNDDEDIVVAEKTSKGWGKPQSISPNINSPLNEGTCTISADGRILIFTSCVGRAGYGSCDLYESRKTGDEWSVPVNLGPNVNTSEWESQPSLSADGRTLYFVSDRRGGRGRRDIWVTTQDDQGQWGRAINLDEPVNTSGDEFSPFIHVNGQSLYFASNGHVGFGGYDIFSSQGVGGAWSEPVNLGPPINDYEDQFSFFVTSDGLMAYYSHEIMTPAGGRGRLFQVQLPENQRVKFRSNYVHGTITDSRTHRPIKARVELVNLKTDSLQNIVESDSITGRYLMVLTEGAEYGLYVTSPEHMFRSLNFNYSDVSDLEPVVLDIVLDPVRKGTATVLNNIFFDTDKYELKEKSKAELGRVIRFLNENPGITIEVSGHTDNVGSAGYNQSLSEKRAQAVVNYLITSGINSKRLAAKGYGSTVPVASNDTEEGRQQNRRIEFKVR